MKLLLEISKKMFPIASTFILAVEVVAIAGIVSNSEPSLGVLAVIMVG